MNFTRSTILMIVIAVVFFVLLGIVLQAFIAPA